MHATEVNARKNIFRLSSEKVDFERACSEWVFNGKFIDHGEDAVQCELCEHKNLRYQFGISNAQKDELMIGSDCIEKFDIDVIDAHGAEVIGNKSHYLKKLVRAERGRKVLEALINKRRPGELSGYEVTELDAYCMKMFQADRLDALILRYLFLRFEQEGIMFEAKDFAISTGTFESKTKLLRLDLERFNRIRGALDSKQRSYYLKAKGLTDIP